MILWKLIRLKLSCRFPRNPDCRCRWQQAINRFRLGSKSMLWEPKVTDVVCSQHFQESDFYYPGIRKLLKNDAVPSVKKSSNVTNLDLPSIQRPPRRESKENENVRLKNRLAKQRDQLRNTKRKKASLVSQFTHLRSTTRKIDKCWFEGSIGRL